MIVVFGSLNVDMVFEVERLPKAGETVLGLGYSLHSGGKGANQALAAARERGQGAMSGRTGDDDFGSMVRKSLQQGGVDLSLVQTGNERTGCATIFVDHQGDNMIAVACGANDWAQEKNIPSELIDDQTTVLLQMETPWIENCALIKRAHAKGARTILNLAPFEPIPRNIFSDLDFLIVNEGEASQLQQSYRGAPSGLSDFMQYLYDSFHITCIVTRGDRGAIATTENGILSVEAMDTNVVDTTAAGDTFVGVLASNLDRGASLVEAMHRASVAGGLACEKVGAQTSVPHADAIDAAMHRVPAPVFLDQKN